MLAALIRRRFLVLFGAVALGMAGCFLFPSLDEYGRCAEGRCAPDAAQDGAGRDGNVVETGCSTHIDSDDLNCGRCGRTCLGGACVASECQPVKLASGLDYVAHLRGDDQVLFISSANFGSPVPAPLRRFDKYQADAVPTPLMAAGLGVSDLAWGDGGIYASSTDGNLYKVDVDASAASVVFSTPDAAPRGLSSVAALPGAVFALSDGLRLYRVGPDGGAPAPLDVSPFGPRLGTLTTDRESVYGAAPEGSPVGVWKYRPDGGAPAMFGFTGGDGPARLFYDETGEYIYWTRSVDLPFGRTSLRFGASSQVRVNLAQLEPYDGSSFVVRDIAITRDYVFVAVTDAAVSWIVKLAKSAIKDFVPGDDSTKTRAESVFKIESRYLRAIHVDSKALYWVDDTVLFRRAL